MPCTSKTRNQQPEPTLAERAVVAAWEWHAAEIREALQSLETPRARAAVAALTRLLVLCDPEVARRMRDLVEAARDRAPRRG